MTFVSSIKGRRAITLRPFLLLTAAFFSLHCGGAASTSSENPTPGLNVDDYEMLGGDTSLAINTNASFSQPANNLTFVQKGDFGVGNSFFEQDWVIAPASTIGRDGLGPVFNARSCAGCHFKDGRGRPPLAEEDLLSLLFRLSVPGSTPTGEPKPEPNYGGQLQPFGNPGVDGEGDVDITLTPINGSFADGESYTLLKPTYTFTDLAYGDMSSSVMVSPRVAQQMIGMGLLDAIAEDEIVDNEDVNDDDGDGISGKANRVWDVLKEETNLGRFGWKANVPTVDQQVAGAFNGDLGITSSLFEMDACTSAQPDCLSAMNGGEPEIPDHTLDLVIFYSKTLAVPAQRNPQNQQVIEGQKIFKTAGCASCHTPTFTTASEYPITQLADQTIHPFTDLLLHDMGADLADNRPDFLADGNEWRTPPLWGIGLIEKVNGHTRYLHDGRARDLKEAILWHGGEAQRSKENFVNMDKGDRDALIAFLQSL